MPARNRNRPLEPAMIRHAILTACLALLSVPADAGDLGTVRTFQNWTAGCDNGRACRAVSMLAEDATGRWFLSLDRDAAAAAPVRLTLMPQSETYPRSGTLRLRAAGADLATLKFGKDIRLEDDGLIIEDRNAVAAVLAAMRSASTLELVFEQQSAGAEVKASISLVGAKAGLLWIDERQRRLNTVTALVRRGGKPASAVPVPPALPLIVAERTTDGGPPPEVLPEAILREMIRQSAGYCDEDGSGPDTDAKNMVRLGPGLVLASVRCFSGAYNFARAYFLIEEGTKPVVRPALFPRPVEQKVEEDRELTPDNVLWNANFGPDSTEISHFSKGRGIADCGETGVWRWDGRAFQTVLLTEMNSCSGVMAGYWPHTYSSRE
ncbi:hypothetical protein B5K08_02405 [Rhizobium leguminosarum bv. trifolii]|uniref:DUF1176 domain-containing protein n=2 Tax=Rhizobium leguminosarum TaxID=384 RepID=A0A3E1BWC0_RHILT|nr:hypothetical protein B5K08_02405 [Rhizobium leguminosarum bv. trifolii]RFB99408.1 hypothetical protein B5K10_02400 [Rhizobium leguminosarum bv. trifolii]